MLLLNGYASGIEINDPHFSDDQLAELELGILQAARLRMSKTEYIACPGCGRTLFDLQRTLKEVKEATAHLKALDKVSRVIPTMLKYKTHVDKGSMFNTPPVLPIYAALQTLKYYKSLGGIREIEKMDIAKAEKLYEAIDTSKMFVATVQNKEDRSIMNVCFVMKPEYAEYEKDFIDFASSKGIVGIKGQRDVGGFRASLYNALPMESVEALVDCMHEFESLH